MKDFSLQFNGVSGIKETTAEVLETPRRPNRNDPSVENRMADANYPIWGFPCNMHVCSIPFKGVVR